MRARHLLLAAIAAVMSWLSPALAREGDAIVVEVPTAAAPPKTASPGAVPPVEAIPLPTTPPKKTTPAVESVAIPPVADGCCSEPCHHRLFGHLFCCRPHLFCGCHIHCFLAHFRPFHKCHSCGSCDSCGSTGYAWVAPSGNAYVWVNPGYSGYWVHQGYPLYPQYQPIPVSRPSSGSGSPAALTLVSRRSLPDAEKLAEAKSPELLVGNGFSDFFEGKHGSALANFDGSLVKDAKNPMAWYGKALSERAMGDEYAALTALRRADKLLRDQRLPEAKLNGLIERLATADRQWLRESRNP
jgi:hypothetical protein